MPSQCCKDTWESIPDDEPVFILRGKDLLSVQRVEDWIDAAEAEGVNPGKLESARGHVTAMLDFQDTHPERCKIPD